MPGPASEHPGLLLVQAGKQLEHLTGGLVRAGYHEVVVNGATVGAMETRRQQEQQQRPQIRISSTFFWHLSSDYDLEPVAALRDRAAAVRADQALRGRDEGDEVAYPAMKVGEQVQEYVSITCMFPTSLTRSHP